MDSGELTLFTGGATEEEEEQPILTSRSAMAELEVFWDEKDNGYC